MNILFTRFPLESAFGGAEVQTLSLMQGLQARGHNVAFLGSCPTLLTLCKEHNIPHAELQIGPPPVSKWHALSFAWRKQHMQQQLEAALQEFTKLDAVFMLSLSEKILLTPLALQQKIPVIWQEHDRIGRWLRYNPWLPRLRNMSANVTTVCVSDLSHNLYTKLGWPADKVIGIPNGVALPPADFQAHKVGGSLHVGCIARLTKDKGVDVLIDAIKNVPNATLSIVGKGREERRILQRIRDCDVSDRVRLHHHADVNELYELIDVLVLPSRDNDPFGLVVAEAMLRGIPTVITDQCGIASYLENGVDTLVCSADDSECLTHHIHALANPKKHEQIAKGGQQTALQKFTLDTMLDQYETLLTFR